MIRSKLLVSTAAALVIGFAGSSMANVDLRDLCMASGTESEVSESSLHAIFQSIDADGNGFLSSDEYEACLSASAEEQGETGEAAERMAKFDANADNRISRDEFLAAGGALTGSATGADSGTSEQLGSQSSAQDEGSDTAATGITSSQGVESEAEATGDAASAKSGQDSAASTGSTVESGQSASSASEPESGQQVQTDGEGTGDVAGAESDQDSTAGTGMTAESGDSASSVSELESTEQSMAPSTDDSTAGTAGSVEVEPPSEGAVAYNDAELQQLASDLIGKNLVNSNGEDLGEIEDFVVNDDGGAVFAIAGIGGFLGIGEKNIAVPFEDLELRDEEVVMITPMTKEELKDMPPYEEGTWRSIKGE